jgi:hypothetical protein
MFAKVGSKMKEETKQSLKGNAGTIFLAIVIVASIIFSKVTGISLDDLDTVITLSALLIFAQCFTQAIQHEPEETRRKIMIAVTIIGVVLFILMLLGFMVFFLTK